MRARLPLAAIVAMDAALRVWALRSVPPDGAGDREAG
jgi:hypothetical protein